MTTKQFSLVIDSEGKQLSPTNANKAWYLIRKQKAKLITRFPMVIQLLKIVKVEEIDSSRFVCGIDTGSKHTGIAIVQECKTKSKVILKGTIKHRNDVKKLIVARAVRRRYRRNHKRYRPARFNNRAASKRKGRIAPSIKQKKESILRVISRLKKYVFIQKYIVEDVLIDIRKLQEPEIKSIGYQQSNKLDSNIRMAVMMRDKFKCQECKTDNVKLEVHHITPKRLNGNNTVDNLIALCVQCHKNTQGNEENFINKYSKLIKGKNIRFGYAQHVMQGKTYLRNELNKMGLVELTAGCETANKRHEWNIPKSHSNDAIVICNNKVNIEQCDIIDWIIKPLRGQLKAEYKEAYGLTHRDVVSYITRKKEEVVGYIVAIYSDGKQMNIQTEGKKWTRINPTKCRLISRPNRIMWRYNYI